MGLTPIEDAGCRPMKRTNGVPPRGAIQDGFLTRRARCRCRSSGKLSQGGGCFPILQCGVSTAHVPISLPRRYLSVIARPALADPAEKGRTGATPPFLPLYRQAGREGVSAGVSPSTPSFGGRSRPNYPCGKAVELMKKPRPVLPVTKILIYLGCGTLFPDLFEVSEL